MGLQDHMEPSQRQAALDIAGQSSKDGLAGDGMVERLVESRFGSLERLVAMQVMFYHMAARIAGFWCVLHLLFAVARNPSLCLIWSRWSDIAKVSLCCCLTKALQISFCLPEEIALCFVVFGMRLQCLLRLGCRPLCFSVDRSQSCLRIATTASPVSAADLKST